MVTSPTYMVIRTSFTGEGVEEGPQSLVTPALSREGVTHVRQGVLRNTFTVLAPFRGAVIPFLGGDRG